MLKFNKQIVKNGYIIKIYFGEMNAEMDMYKRVETYDGNTLVHAVEGFDMLVMEQAVEFADRVPAKNAI